jgi:hypothetical protein
MGTSFLMAEATSGQVSGKRGQAHTDSNVACTTSTSARRSYVKSMPYTLLGDDGLPVGAAEAYLSYPTRWRIDPRTRAGRPASCSSDAAGSLVRCATERHPMTVDTGIPRPR